MIDWSEFGHLWLVHVRDRFDVSFIPTWHNASIHLAFLGSLVLQFINVAKFIANCAWGEFNALRERLDQWQHLWSQSSQCSSVAQVKKATRSFLEIAVLVETLMVEWKLLEGKDLASNLKERLDVLVPEGSLVESISRHFKAQVDQVDASHSLDI